MKCLLDSNVTAVTAKATNVPNILNDVNLDELQTVDGDQIEVFSDDVTLVDSEYPPENVLDEHPKRVSKISWPVGEWTLAVEGTGSTVLLGGTNARTAEFNVFNAAGENIYSEITDLGGIASYQRFILDSGLKLNYTSITYPYQTPNHTIKIRLSTGNTEDVYVGLIQAGALFTTSSDALIGLSEDQNDYSIGKQMSNGSFYYKKRDIVRVFTGSVLLSREPDFYEFMYTIFKAKGKAPLFWQITNLDSEKWFVYARAVELPSGTHSEHTRSRINFQLIEVL